MLFRSPLAAAEMVMVRLTYASDLPTPGEIVAGAGNGTAAPSGPSGGRPAAGGGGGRSTSAMATSSVRAPSANGQVQAIRAEPNAAPAAQADATPDPKSFVELVQLFQDRREGILHAHLVNGVHLISFEPGKLVFQRAASAPRNLNALLKPLLDRWTGRTWTVFMEDNTDRKSTRLNSSHRT